MRLGYSLVFNLLASLKIVFSSSVSMFAHMNVQFKVLRQGMHGTPI